MFKCSRTLKSYFVPLLYWTPSMCLICLLVMSTCVLFLPYCTYYSLCLPCSDTLHESLPVLIVSCLIHLIRLVYRDAVVFGPGTSGFDFYIKTSCI